MKAYRPYIIISLQLMSLVGLYGLSGYTHMIGGVTGVFEYICVLLIIAMAREVVIVSYRRKKHFLAKEQIDNFILGINQVTVILYAVVALSLILLLFRVSLKQAFTALSFVAAAIAIVTKDYLSNMLNAMILAFSDNISVGDHVSVGEHKGRIVNITLQNVHIINDDDNLVLIPNNIFLQKETINYTKRYGNKISIDFELRHDFVDCIDDFESYLIAHLQDLESDFIQPHSYFLKTAEIKSECYLFRFQYQRICPNAKAEKKVRRIIMRAIANYRKNKKPSISAKQSPKYTHRHIAEMP